MAWNIWRKENPSLVPDLSGAQLLGAFLSGVNLSEADLSYANLSELGAYPNVSNLCCANLRGANLREANLSGAYLGLANLSNADLSGAYLGGVNLNWASLRDARLVESNLYCADLTRTNLRDANLTNANMNGANLSGADLTRANLTGACMVGAWLLRTNFELAILTGCRIYGASVWEARLNKADQLDVVITPDDQPQIEVDGLEYSQFVHSSLISQGIRVDVDRIDRRAALIMGCFTSERKTILNTLRRAIRQRGLLPIWLDFEKPNGRGLQETILTLAGLSQFILAEISDPRSVPQELAAVVPSLPSVRVQPLLQSGYEPCAAFDQIRLCGSVLPLHTYKDQQKLSEELEQVVSANAEAGTCARNDSPHA